MQLMKVNNTKLNGTTFPYTNKTITSHIGTENISEVYVTCIIIIWA